MYELDLPKFLSALRLAWQAALKNAGVELELLTDVDMLLMVEKGIEIYYSFFLIKLQQLQVIPENKTQGNL